MATLSTSMIEVQEKYQESTLKLELLLELLEQNLAVLPVSCASFAVYSDLHMDLAPWLFGLRWCTSLVYLWGAGS